MNSIVNSLANKSNRSYYYFVLFILHIFIFIWFQIVLSPFQGFFKHFCYMTMMSFYLNFIYYTWMLLIEKKIIKNSNIEFQHTYFKFSYNLSFIVFVMYYGMILVNPAMLSSGRLEFPILLDVFLHGLNYLFNVVEVLFINPKENSHKVNKFTYIVFSIAYSSFLLILWHVFEIVVYPFVKDLSLVKFVGLTLSNLAMIYVGDLSYKYILKHKSMKKLI